MKINLVTSLGVTEKWQLPLLVPNSCSDLTNPRKSFFEADVFVDSKYVFCGRINTQKSISATQRPPYQVKFHMLDIHQRSLLISFYLKDTNEQQNLLAQLASNQGGEIYVAGTIKVFDTTPVLVQPKIIEPHELKLSLTYPAPRGIEPAAVESLVRQALRVPDILNESKRNVLTSLQLKESQLNYFFYKETNGLVPSFDNLIQCLHQPTDIKEFDAGKKCLRLAQGMKAILDGKTHKNIIAPSSNLELDMRLVDDLIDRLPFTSTSEQRSITRKIATKLASDVVALDLLSADVGFGKTSVFAVLAAATALSGKVAVIIEPNEILSKQVANNIRSYWPEVKVLEVTANITQVAEDINSCILVGTTAINFFLNEIEKKPGLIICDEEHRFGTEQKNAFNDPSINYIGVTATCIPRTMQLAMLGSFEIHKITTCHVSKNINTNLRYIEDVYTVFNTAQETLNNGKQVIVVYPLAVLDPDAVNDDDVDDFDADSDTETPGRTNKLDPELVSSEISYQAWNSMFPEQVAWVYGKMNHKEKQEQIHQFVSGKKNLLVATSAIEVGLDSKHVSHLIVVHPERHGNKSLHQIRGRLCRAGGEGVFDMFIPKPEDKVKQKIKDRLGVLAKTTDGFIIAEDDLRRRGFGSLKSSATEQSGYMPDFIPGLIITPDDVEFAANFIDSIKEEIRNRQHNQTANQLTMV